MASLKSVVGKIVIIGDAGVGKTTLLRTYLSSGFEFSGKYSMTMGVIPNVAEMKISDNNDVKILFYDTTSSDVYYGILSKYWEAPDIALIVYDVSTPSSFANLSHWLELIKNIKWSKEAKDHPITVAIFANKTDLIERRVVSSEMGKKCAEEFKMNYFEGSAKTNEGINEMCQWLAQKWFLESVSNTYTN